MLGHCPRAVKIVFRFDAERLGRAAEHLERREKQPRHADDGEQHRHLEFGDTGFEALDIRLVGLGVYLLFEATDLGLDLLFQAADLGLDLFLEAADLGLDLFLETGDLFLDTVDVRLVGLARRESGDHVLEALDIRLVGLARREGVDLVFQALNIRLAREALHHRVAHRLRMGLGLRVGDPGRLELPRIGEGVEGEGRFHTDKSRFVPCPAQARFRRPAKRATLPRMETREASPADIARRLCRERDRAALSTAARDAEGWPYGSLALVACRFDGAPLLLLSRLALHTANLAADARLCLLYDDTAGLNDPLSGARASVFGRAEAEDDPEALARFLRRHPAAERYAGFDDFSLWRVVAERIHLVAGYGAVDEVDSNALTAPDAPELERAEAGIVKYMNESQSAAVADCARRFARRAGGGRGWRLTGIDPFGIDLRRGGRTARGWFDSPVDTPQSAARAFAQLVQAARAA